MRTQREELAKRGYDPNNYDIFLSAPDPRLGIDDETTGIMVVEKATNRSRRKTVPYSRRELAADPTGKVYYDTIVELIQELEGK